MDLISPLENRNIWIWFPQKTKRKDSTLVLFLFFYVSPVWFSRQIDCDRCRAFFFFSLSLPLVNRSIYSRIIPHIWTKLSFGVLLLSTTSLSFSLVYIRCNNKFCLTHTFAGNSTLHLVLVFIKALNLFSEEKYDRLVK
jgi:hypothetical protein